MVKPNNRIHTARGFTLVEAMVGMAVLAFGLLAIANFQSGLLANSAHSKARAEAVALAQEKLDDIRSYSVEEELVAKLHGAANPTVGNTFPESVVNGTYSDFTANNPYDGVNADFTRSWVVTVTGEIAKVVVTVGWQDRRNNTEQVSLETDVTWMNIRGTADLGTESRPLVRSPTGRAFLGDGQATDTAVAALVAAGGGNNDGTVAGDYDNDGDLELIDMATNAVVLTLPNACIDGQCTDFVKIRGTVFLDVDSDDVLVKDTVYRNVGGTTISPEGIFLLASDAAYCSRSYYDGEGVVTVTSSSVLPNSANGVDSDNDGVAEFATTDDSYDYFNYTCYLGTGWYGNVGMLISGAKSEDVVCVGDPTASFANPADKWKRPEIAKRRVYRGMSNLYDISGTVGVDVNTNYEVLNPEGDVIFFSQGVEDAITLPDPDWASRGNGHNFVLTNVSSGTNDINHCVAAMSKLSTSEGLFTNSTGDFNCFNEDNINTGTITNGYTHTFYPWKYMYLPGSKLDAYTARGTCPYDPSDPPASRYTLAGTIYVDSTSTATWGSGGPDSGFDALVETSDGYGNCRITSTSSTAIGYECDYYVWGTHDNQGNFVENPWTGFVSATAADGMQCTAGNPGIDDLSAATYTQTATSEEIYGEGDTNGDGVVDVNDTFGGIEKYVADDSAAVSVDFYCPELSKHRISGVLSTNSGNDLDANAGSGLLVQYLGSGDTSPVDCTLTPAFGDVTQVGYECQVEEQTYTGGWSGEVLVTWPDTYTTDCTFANPTGFSTVMAPDGWAFTALTSDVTGYNNYCGGPRTEATITVIVSADNLYAMTVATVGATTADIGGTCSVDEFVYDGTSATSTYICAVSSENANGFKGDVVVNATDPISGTEIVCSPESTPVNNVKFDTTISGISCEAAVVVVP